MFPAGKAQNLLFIWEPFSDYFGALSALSGEKPGGAAEKTAAPPVLCTGGTVPALGLKEISHSRSRSRVRRTA